MSPRWTFWGVGHSCGAFQRLTTISRFLFLLQPLWKYVERKSRHLFDHNSLYYHTNITAENAVFVPQSLFARRQPHLHGRFFFQLVLPRLCSKNGHQIKHVLVAASTLCNTQSHPPKESCTTPSETLNDYCMTPSDGQKEATKTLYYG